MSNMDETVMSPDGTEVAAGYHPENAFEGETEQTGGLIAIPPMPRTVIYYALALTNAVVVPLIASGAVDATVGAIVLGVASVFGFTMAGGNVLREA